jgi:TorA maturation chaperone TorD
MTVRLAPGARRDIYALTARLFAAEVDVALYRALLAQDPLGLLEAELRRMSEAQALETLAVEFCRLFIGPQPLCVPYASAQRGDALLGGRARTRLEDFMHRVGFVYDADALRLASPDHLAVELAVLAHLYALEETAPAVRAFLQEHMLPWVPTYCAHVAAVATLSLYRTAAQLVRTLLEDEISTE